MHFKAAFLHPLYSSHPAWVLLRRSLLLLIKAHTWHFKKKIYPQNTWCSRKKGKWLRKRKENIPPKYLVLKKRANDWEKERINKCNSIHFRVFRIFHPLFLVIKLTHKYEIFNNKEGEGNVSFLTIASTLQAVPHKALWKKNITRVRLCHQNQLQHHATLHLMARWQWDSLVSEKAIYTVFLFC